MGYWLLGLILLYFLLFKLKNKCTEECVKYVWFKELLSRHSGNYHPGLQVLFYSF